MFQQELNYQPPLAGREEERLLDITGSVAEQRKGLAVLIGSALHRALGLLPQPHTACNYARLGQGDKSNTSPL